MQSQDDLEDEEADDDSVCHPDAAETKNVICSTPFDSRTMIASGVLDLILDVSGCLSPSTFGWLTCRRI
jgi:hypothetical protein